MQSPGHIPLAILDRVNSLLQHDLLRRVLEA